MHRGRMGSLIIPNMMKEKMIHRLVPTLPQVIMDLLEADCWYWPLWEHVMQ